MMWPCRSKVTKTNLSSATPARNRNRGQNRLRRTKMPERIKASLQRSLAAARRRRRPQQLKVNAQFKNKNLLSKQLSNHSLFLSLKCSGHHRLSHKHNPSSSNNHLFSLNRGELVRRMEWKNNRRSLFELRVVLVHPTKLMRTNNFSLSITINLNF